MIDNYHFIIGLMLFFVLGFLFCYCILGYIVLRVFRKKIHESPDSNPRP